MPKEVSGFVPAERHRNTANTFSGNKSSLKPLNRRFSGWPPWLAFLKYPESPITYAARAMIAPDCDLTDAEKKVLLRPLCILMRRAERDGIGANLCAVQWRWAYDAMRSVAGSKCSECWLGNPESGAAERQGGGSLGSAFWLGATS